MEEEVRANEKLSSEVCRGPMSLVSSTCNKGVHSQKVNPGRSHWHHLPLWSPLGPLLPSGALGPGPRSRAPGQGPFVPPGPRPGPSALVLWSLALGPGPLVAGPGPCALVPGPLEPLVPGPWGPRLHYTLISFYSNVKEAPKWQGSTQTRHRALGHQKNVSNA